MLNDKSVSGPKPKINWRLIGFCPIAHRLNPVLVIVQQQISQTIFPKRFLPDGGSVLFFSRFFSGPIRFS